jgi:toxin CptA
VQFPIIIGLHRSRFLDVLLALAGLLAMAAILRFPGTLPVRTGLLIVIMLLTAQAWRALTPTIKSIRLERSGEIFIERVGETDFVQALPGPSATIHPWLTIIRLTATDGRPAALIATVDRKNSQNLRRLRMFMRWQAKFSGPDDDA